MALGPLTAGVFSRPLSVELPDALGVARAAALLRVQRPALAPGVLAMLPTVRTVRLLVPPQLEED